MNKTQYQNSKYKGEVKDIVQQLNALRKDPQNPTDVTLAQFVKSRHGISMDSFFEDLGLNANIDTIQNIFVLPDESVRWLIPEIIRDALRLGLRKNAIWADLVVAEQTIQNPNVTQPWLNMSEAAPRYVGEAEDIPLGTISYGKKTFGIRKMGRGIRIPYEVVNYVTINVIALFLQDFGVQLNMAIDSMLIDVLINGEQSDGSESAPVVGVDNTTNGFTYKDLLRIWVRMSRIGRAPTIIIGGEEAAIATLNLSEFKNRQMPYPPEKTLDLKSPIPSTSSYYIHGSMPSNQQLIVDRSAAVIKYNAQPLLVEDEKIISKQVLATYASLTTGFGILYRDARILVDASLEFASNGFPAYMDVDPLETVTIE